MSSSFNSLGDLLTAYQDVLASEVLRCPESNPQAEREKISLFQDFLSRPGEHFFRHNQEGHVTGSAMVVSQDLDGVLLTLHGKLNRWLQLGGHADGDQDIASVAMREANEESGLEKLNFLTWEPLVKSPLPPGPLCFDIDRHFIPARKNEPEHYHYDVRFVIVADRADEIQISDESHDLRWFDLDEAKQVTDSKSMRRQFAKIEAIRGQL